MLILYEMLHTCSVLHTQRRCKFENTKHRCLGMFLHKCNIHCNGWNQYKKFFFSKAIINSVSLTCFSFIQFYSELTSWYISTPYTYQVWLEQLERLRSEIPPAAPWLPILVIHIRPQVKTRQSQSYKSKKIAKNSNFLNFAKTFTCDTPSEVVW